MWGASSTLENHRKSLGHDTRRGCRDDDVFEFSERLDYVDESGDGSLDGWY